ncbi:MAG: protein translocase subunit SecF [Propionibacteriaceae bacterium]|jgi:preprotein translocase subunit SecF|nr:protein translocase subunit SecF [Propionibacteriaceae bacterium]
MAKKNGLAHRLYTGDLAYDFIKHRKIWYTFTTVLLVICTLALLFKGLNWGIEFKGGSEFGVSFSQSVTSAEADKATQAVQDLALPDNDSIQTTIIGSSEIRVQMRSLSTEEIPLVKQALADVAGTDTDQVSYSLIGASWGQQITQSSLIALLIFIVLVMVLIWIYFRDFKMSICAILALAHDMWITVGVYALVGFTVTPATMIGALTVLGYSLYDTVVVFDKVRENTKDMFNGHHTYSYWANKSINQVVLRSINTTIIGVLPVGALLFGGAFILGTGPLKDLGLALFVGMIAGTYSSIFLATPLLAEMREREPQMKEFKLKLERRAARKAQKANVAAAERTGITKLKLDGGVAVEASDEDVEELSVVSADQFTRMQPKKQSRSERRK